VQDRYVGDIGDFAKFGLLRALAGENRVGIAWYRYPDEDHNSDGSKTGYLEHPEKWRHFDPELFDRLREIVHSKRRTIAGLEGADLLPNAAFSGSLLRCNKTPAARESFRRGWYGQVLIDLSASQLVFADPDNGLRSDESFAYNDPTFWKHVPLQEARHLASGRTAVIYHHNSRFKGGHDAEIQHWLTTLGPHALAVYWRGTSNRTFFVLNPTAAHRKTLSLLEETWQGHFTLRSSDSSSPMTGQENCSDSTKTCPECQQVFRGKGWEGIDAHWKARHRNIMPYEKAWELICQGLKPSAHDPAIQRFTAPDSP
jgi:hypothetical protein